MGIGIGVVLIVIGLVVLFALQGDVPFFTDGTSPYTGAITGQTDECP